MKQSIGQPFLYVIIGIFIVTIFAILIGTMSYFKAYKVNSRIVGIIEKYEGYNDLATTEINNTLRTIGYNISGINCPDKTMSDGTVASNISTSPLYCVYQTNGSVGGYPTIRYGVTTYITVDFPVISSIMRTPITTETNSIYVR